MSGNNHLEINPNQNANETKRQIRNKAVAMLLTGLGTVAVAKACGVPEGTVRMWKCREMTPKQLQELRMKREEKFDEDMLGLLEDTIAAQRFIINAIQDETYLRSHTPEQNAILFETINDRSLRLLDAMQRAAAEGAQVPIPRQISGHQGEDMETIQGEVVDETYTSDDRIS
jgi:hypothetical protein